MYLSLLTTEVQYKPRLDFVQKKIKSLCNLVLIFLSI